MNPRVKSISHLLAIVVLMNSVLGACVLAQVTSGQATYRLPAKGLSKASGLSMTLQSDGIGGDGYGYRKLIYAFQSPTPLTADTTLTVKASAHEMDSNRPSVTAEADIDMLIGQSQATLELQIPQYSPFSVLSWTVWVDGARDTALSQSDKTPAIFPGPSYQQNMAIDRLRVWVATPASPFQMFRQAVSLYTLSRINSNLQQTQQPLTGDWLDYSTFDVVQIDLPTLAAMAKSKPETVAALRQWVTIGGNLWVENIGDRWQRLEELNDLLSLPPLAKADSPTRPADGDLPGVLAWEFIDLAPRQTLEENEGLMSEFSAGDLAPSDSPSSIGAAPPPAKPVYSEDWFAVRRLDWGTIAAYKSIGRSPPAALRRSQRGTAAHFWRERGWPQRHGLIPNSANADFSNWLIPGVGVAPVVEFQVLITLFVLVIGPLNYWLLKRAKRLHLIVLTVPAAALLITTALLAYGLLADGFGARVRALSITYLDQDRGEANSWSRLSYYAAFSPRDGLTFPREAMVYPILPGSNELYASPGEQPQRDIVWTADQQRLTSGWLASRTPTQYLVIEPQTTTAKLVFVTNGESLRVTNQLGGRAELMLAVDEKGQWRLALDVEGGDPVELKPVKHAEAVAEFRDVLQGREPVFPDAIAASQDSPLYYEQQRRTRARYRSQGFDYAVTGVNQNLLHQRWTELLGFAGGEALNLPPRSYVVVSDEALLISTGLESATEDASVHIVIGSW